MLDTVSHSLYIEQLKQKQKGNIFFFQSQHKHTFCWKQKKRPYNTYVTIDTVKVLRPMSHTTCPKAPIHWRTFLTPYMYQKLINRLLILQQDRHFLKLLAISTWNQQKKRPICESTNQSLLIQSDLALSQDIIST